jgi:hypothetical protein
MWGIEDPCWNSVAVYATLLALTTVKTWIWKSGIISSGTNISQAKKTPKM